jgi:ParB family chromosome partitioning protein
MDAITGVLAKKIEQWPVDKPTIWPGNPRRGNLETIKTSIETLGFYQPIIIQESTGYVIAGNHRLTAARELKMAEVPVVVLPVGEEQARRMVLMDNKSGDDATYNTDLLVEQLGWFDIDDLEGTGWSQEEVEKLLEPPTDVIDGDAEKDDDMIYTYGVVIECSDENEQAFILDEQVALGRKVRALI